MVERFFRDISENRLRRGVFTSVPQLTTAIEQYVAHHNANPKPFIWTATARDILQKVIRANSRLSGKQNATLQFAHAQRTHKKSAFPRIFFSNARLQRVEEARFPMPRPGTPARGFY